MSTYSHYTDEELMLEIKAGNMLAFDELYRKYSRRLFRFSCSILKYREEAENIIQDVFLKLWLHRDEIHKSSSVKFYIFTIAYNSSVSVIRKKAKESQFIEYVKSLQDVVQESADVQIEYKELDEKLKRVVKTLPLRQKEIYQLHKVEGLKYSEIAEKLNISVNTVENLMSRALKKIRHRLGEYSLISILFFYLFV
jgi:RNA polymerase sigma-70 factor (ECF subfamily)